MEKVALKEKSLPQFLKLIPGISEKKVKNPIPELNPKLVLNLSAEEILANNFFKLDSKSKKTQVPFIAQQDIRSLIDSKKLLEKAQAINPDVLMASLEKNKLVFVIKDKDGVLRRHVAPLNIVDPKRVVNFLKNVFMPKDYEKNCSKDYLVFRSWIAVSNFLDYVFNIIGLNIFFKAMMSATGGGAAAAGAAAATAFTWVLKDLSAYLGILASSSTASKVDRNPQKYFMQGSGIIGAGNILDMALAFMPQYALPVSCAANAIKAAGGVRVGPAFSAIEKHQALNNNMGEIRFKAMAQNAITSGFGVAAAYGLQQVFSNTAAPFIFPLIAAVLKAGSIFADYKAIQSLDINNITGYGLRKLIRNHILNGDILKPEKKGMLETIKQIMTDRGEENRGYKLVLGEKVDRLTSNVADLRKLENIYREENYLLDFDKDNTVKVVLHNDAALEDIVKAVFQSELLGFALKSDYYKQLKQIMGSDIAHDKILSMSYQATPENMRGFLENLKGNGWDTSLIDITAMENRYVWNKPQSGQSLPAISIEEFLKTISS